MATSELITSFRAFLKCVFGRGKEGGEIKRRTDRQTDHEHTALRAHASPKFAFLLVCSLTFPSCTSPSSFSVQEGQTYVFQQQNNQGEVWGKQERSCCGG